MTTHTKPKPKDAVALLKADHKEVKEMFQSFDEAEELSEKKSIAEEAMKELRVHSVIEEEIFYPALRKALGGDGTELMDESEEEHRVAKTIIEELSEGDTSDEHFQAKFTVLAESVRHHIKEEETKMFKDAKGADVDLQALGERMMARKQQLLDDEDELEAAEQKSRVKPYQEMAVAP